MGLKFESTHMIPTNCYVAQRRLEHACIRAAHSRGFKGGFCFDEQGPPSVTHEPDVWEESMLCMELIPHQVICRRGGNLRDCDRNRALAMEYLGSLIRTSWRMADREPGI